LKEREDTTLAHDLTKARLLEAAGVEFAEKGFDGATIRSISQRAGANIAAVNYHFGDKERLYEAAVLEAHACSHNPLEESDMVDSSPEENLRLYVRRFLSNVMGGDRRSTWHDALMTRELLQPTAASDSLVRITIRPRFERLIQLLRALCPEADERRLHALAFSVVGQVLHYKAARSISVRLVGEEAYARLDVDYLADHISSFCLAAFGLAPTIGSRDEAALAKGGS
jgi:AcrR family transcriptional regulator